MNFTNIFIVGTGRSGTHFLCQSLLDFENITDFMGGKENHSILVPLTHMAIRHQPLSKKIISYYKKQIAKANKQGKIFLDQSHTNLFHVEQLAKIFPNSLFLGTQRPTEQVVASMMVHGKKGVRRWFKFARKDVQTPFPNQFLGIDRGQLLTMDTISLCTNRVLAHNKKTKELNEKFNNFRIVQFEDLVNNKARTLQSIFEPKELKLIGKYTDRLPVKKETLDKYKTQFTAQEIKRIKNESSV